MEGESKNCAYISMTHLEKKVESQILTYVYENSNGFSSMAEGKLPTHLSLRFHFPGCVAEVFPEEVKKRKTH
jgi:hypothetical protein